MSLELNAFYCQFRGALRKLNCRKKWLFTTKLRICLSIYLGVPVNLLNGDKNIIGFARGMN